MLVNPTKFGFCKWVNSLRLSGIRAHVYGIADAYYLNIKTALDGFKQGVHIADLKDAAKDLLKGLFGR